MWNRECAGMCGAVCGYEPITKEEQLALLDRKERILREKLEYVRRVKESLKSETPAKAK